MLPNCAKHLQYYFGRCLSELIELVPLFHLSGRTTFYSDRLYDFSVIIYRCHKGVYFNSFFPICSFTYTICLICFPDLSSFSCNFMPYSDCSALHGVTIFKIFFIISHVLNKLENLQPVKSLHYEVFHR